jgi:hypothetical protein
MGGTSNIPEDLTLHFYLKHCDQDLNQFKLSNFDLNSSQFQAQI